MQEQNESEATIGSHAMSSDDSVFCYGTTVALVPNDHDYDCLSIAGDDLSARTPASFDITPSGQW